MIWDNGRHVRQSEWYDYSYTSGCDHMTEQLFPAVLFLSADSVVRCLFPW